MTKITTEADTLSQAGLKIGPIAAYAVPACGLATLLFFVQFFFLKYGTEVLLLSPAIVGLLLGAAKVWDAVLDPAVGSLSDRTRSKWGRRHPWLWLSMPLIAIGFMGIWMVPAGFEVSLKIGLCALALLVFYTGYTFQYVPHTAFGVELSSNSHQRVRAFGARQMMWSLGLVLSFVVLQMADGKAQSQLILIMLVLAGLALLAMTTTPAFLRPRHFKQQKPQKALWEDYRRVAGEKGAVALFVVWLIDNIGVGAIGALAPFYAEYVLGRPDLVGALPGAYAVAGILSIPIWVRLSSMLGKKKTWLSAMVLGAGGFLLMYFAAEVVSLVFLALALAGAAMGCGGVMSFAIMSDLVDRTERRTGVRSEGAFTAMLGFSLKAGIALASALAGFMLSYIGFQANEVQSADVLNSFRFFFVLFPVIDRKSVV